MNKIISFIYLPFHHVSSNLTAAFSKDERSLFNRIGKIFLSIIEICAVVLPIIAFRLWNKKINVISPKPPETTQNKSQKDDAPTSAKVEKTAENVSAAAGVIKNHEDIKLPLTNPECPQPAPSCQKAEASDFSPEGIKTLNPEMTIGRSREEQAFGSEPSKRRMIEEALQEVSKLPEDILENDNEFKLLLHAAEKLKSVKILTPEEYAEARLAQIKAGNQMLKCIENESQIIKNAEEYSHVESMLSLAIANFDLYKDPFYRQGVEFNYRVVDTTIKRTGAPDYIRLKYLETSLKWHLQAAEQLKKDQKIYSGHDLTTLQEAIRGNEKSIQKVNSYITALNTRMSFFNNGKFLLQLAYAAAYEAGNDTQSAQIARFLGKDLKNKNLFAVLYSKAYDEKCKISLQRLSCCKKLAAKYASDKKLELEQARKIFEENKRLYQVDEENIIDITTVNAQIDVVHHLHGEYIDLQEISHFIEKNAKATKEEAVSSDELLNQAFLSLFQAVERCSREAINHAKQIAIYHHECPQALDVCMAFQELAIGKSVFVKINKQISLYALKALFDILIKAEAKEAILNCLSVVFDNKEMVDWLHEEAEKGSTETLRMIENGAKYVPSHSSKMSELLKSIAMGDLKFASIEEKTSINALEALFACMGHAKEKQPFTDIIHEVFSNSQITGYLEDASKEGSTQAITIITNAINQIQLEEPEDLINLLESLKGV